MGCRPSKQATSKVRSVDHAEDPKCLCSPRKVRKAHRCDSSNSSKRASGDSRGDGKKQSLSSGHRPRSAKSADLDFPAFSTTTAVYRKSASKTSKITLRLSCDGSTLEIEQCDYDLEKVQGDTESKPRPWSSAPNLTRLRDTKTRLFRDAYLPMKHSASAWSPSVASTASGAHGGQIRVPVQINTPDDRLTSPGNAKGYYCSLATQNGSNSSREQSSKSFGSDIRGKLGSPLQRPRLRASSGFAVSDEREPLLHGSDDGSQRLAGAENSINTACETSSSHLVRKECMPHSNTLNDMLNSLEDSLELTHVITHSSGPVPRRPRSLEVNHASANGELSLHKQITECGPKRDLLYSSSGERYNSDCSPDFEQIPVNVVSFVPPPPSAMAGVRGGNHNSNVTASDIYFPVNQPPGTCTARNGSGSGHKPSSIGRTSQIPHRINSDHLGVRKDELSCSEDKTFDFLNCTDMVYKCSNERDTDMTMHEGNQDDCVSQFPRQSSCSSSTDSESVLNFVKLGCPVTNEMPNFMYASGDESPLSMFTPQHHILCPPGQGCPGQFQHCHLAPGASNDMDRDEDVINHDCDLCMNVDASDYCDQDSPLDNLTQFVLDSSESDGTGRGFAPFNAQVFMRGGSGDLRHKAWLEDRNDSGRFPIPPPPDRNCGYRENTKRDQDRSLTNASRGYVEENYLLSRDIERPLEEQRSFCDKDIRNTSSHAQGLGGVGYCKPGHKVDHVRTLASQTQSVSGRIGQCVSRGDTESREDGNVNSSYHAQSRGVNVRTNPKENPVPGMSEVYKGDRTGRLPLSAVNKSGNCAVIEEDSMDDRSDFDDTENESDSVHYLVSMKIHGPEDSQSEYHQQESDTDSKNADYLMELLNPQPSSRSAKVSKGNRFTYDFDFSQQHECDMSSHSDASDNEISPQCYVLIGHHKPISCEIASAANNNSWQDCKSPGFTSMEKVRLDIVESNLTKLLHRIQELDKLFTRSPHGKNGYAMNEDVGVAPATEQYSNSHTNTIYCVAGPVIHFPGSVDHTGINSISPMASIKYKSSQRMEYPIKSTANITIVKSIEDGNSERKTKRTMMRLCAEILARNITAVASELNITDVYSVLWPDQSKSRKPGDKMSDTSGKLCKEHSDPVSARSIAGVDTFPSDLIFSSGTFTQENILKQGESCGTATGRQIRVDARGGRTSIDASTSALWPFGQNSKGQRGECVIDSGDRIHLNLDEIPDHALASQCHMYGDCDLATGNTISEPSFNNNDDSVERCARTRTIGMISFSNADTSNPNRFSRVCGDAQRSPMAPLSANSDEVIKREDSRVDVAETLPAMMSSQQTKCRTQTTQSNAPQSISSRGTRQASASSTHAMSQHQTTTPSVSCDSNFKSTLSVKTSHCAHDCSLPTHAPIVTTLTSDSSIDLHVSPRSADKSSPEALEPQVEKERTPTEITCGFSNGLAPACVFSCHYHESRILTSRCEDRNIPNTNPVAKNNGSGLCDVGPITAGQKTATIPVSCQERAKGSNQIELSDSNQDQNKDKSNRTRNGPELSESQHQSQHSSQHEQCSTYSRDITEGSVSHGSLCHHLPSQFIDQPPISKPSAATSGRNHRSPTTPNTAYLPLDGSHTSSSLLPSSADSAEVNNRVTLIDSMPVDNGSVSNFEEGEGEKMEEINMVPRRNVLSLVQYFEKVPYTRNDPKQ